tara:strand:+ start:1836 stop:2864 length:1029 start_codon:yes stop_codon:yes gene_type:complete
MSLKNLSVKIKIPKQIIEKFKNKKLKKIYKKFEQSLKINDNFAVAVSGGPDSLAMAFLSKVYSIKKNLKAKFYIVDHKLRNESTNEANQVKKVLKKYDISCKILTWRGKKPNSNIQSLARKKRYELLFHECKKNKINNILLGHHYDDLLENFFIRILRGSGLKGLVSLDEKTKIGNKNILRPLLYSTKEDLLFVSKLVFNFYVVDPTNFDEKFQRIRIRKMIKFLENNGLDMKKFLKTIGNLKTSNSIVDFYVTRNLKVNSYFNFKKDKIILSSEFFLNPSEVVFRSLSDIIKIVGKKHYSVRGRKLDYLIKKVQKSSNLKVTLGGCIIEKVNQTVIISKEH